MFADTAGNEIFLLRFTTKYDINKATIINAIRGTAIQTAITPRWLPFGFPFLPPEPGHPISSLPSLQSRLLLHLLTFERQLPLRLQGNSFDLHGGIVGNTRDTLAKHPGLNLTSSTAVSPSNDVPNTPEINKKRRNYHQIVNRLSTILKIYINMFIQN